MSLNSLDPSVYPTETGRICPDGSPRGGAAKDGVIEVLVDHVATVMAELAKLGCAVNRPGG